MEESRPMQKFFPTCLVAAMARVFVGVPAVAAGPAEAAAPFVANGRRMPATIVVERDLPRKQRRAPADLARYLETITGVPVPVKKDPAGVSGLKIRIGPSDYVEQQRLRLDDLWVDGYVIKLVDPENLVIVGGAHLGTGFGIYDFLKRVCGCRWFMPGPLGEVVPRRREIALDGLDIRSEPSVPSVWVRPIFISNLKVKHFRRYHWAGHNLHRLTPPAKYGEAHPEYFPLLNGRRFVPSAERHAPWQPCVSNPEIPAFVGDVARWTLSRFPHARVVSVGVNDGGGDCLCRKCTAQDLIRDGTRCMGDRYARFLNACAAELKKEFPDLLLGFQSYGGIFKPPQRVKLTGRPYVRIGGRPRILEAFEQWSQRAAYLGTYEFLYGTPILEPRHYPHVIGAHLKTLVKKYRIVSFAAEAFPFWPLDAPKLHVVHELLWDIDQDVDALLHDFFTNFYVEAATPMAAFFQRIEDVYRRRQDQQHFIEGINRAGFHGWNLEDLAAMDAQLAAAEAAAREPTVQARVRIVDQAWRHIRCSLRVHVRTCLLNDMRIRSERDAGTALEHARAIFASLTEKAEWDAMVLDDSRYPSEEYRKFYVARHYAESRPGVDTVPQAENAVEQAFERISQLAGLDARAFWRGIAQAPGQAPRLRQLARSQLFLLANAGKLENLVADGGFEDTSLRRPPMSDEMLRNFRWRRVKDVPADFGVWSYTGRPARFVWTDKLAHGGARCIGIEANEVKANFVRHFIVKPGERYRVSAFATRIWEGNIWDVNPFLCVAWQGVLDGKNGWTKDPRASQLIPIDVSGAWKRGTLRVTVPAGATKLVLMLGVNGSQLGGGGAYFDDLRVEEIGTAE